MQLVGFVEPRPEFVLVSRMKGRRHLNVRRRDDPFSLVHLSLKAGVNVISCGYAALSSLFITSEAQRLEITCAVRDHFNSRL